MGIDLNASATGSRRSDGGWLISSSCFQRACSSSGSCRLCSFTSGIMVFITILHKTIGRVSNPDMSRWCYGSHPPNYPRFMNRTALVDEEVRCIARFYPYGAHFRETVDVLIPDKTRNPRVDKHSWTELFVGICRDVFGLLTCYPRAVFAYIAEWLDEPHELPSIEEAKKFPAILFVHGGGYCAVNSTIQHHQTTAFVRAGYAVYRYVM